MKQLIDVNLQKLKASSDLNIQELPPYGLQEGQYFETEGAVQGLGNVPERSKEEEETPMRLSDRKQSDVNRRRKKGDRLRPVQMQTALSQQKPSEFLTPTNQQNDGQKKNLLLHAMKEDVKKGKKDDIFAQIQKGLTKDNNSKLRKDDKGLNKNQTGKKDLLGQLNRKIAARKRQLSSASLNPSNKNSDIITMDMYKRSPLHQHNPYVRCNPSIIPGDPPLNALLPNNPSRQQKEQSPPDSSSPPGEPAQNLYYPRHPSLGMQGGARGPNPFQPNHLGNNQYPSSFQHSSTNLIRPVPASTTTHSPSNPMHHRSTGSFSKQPLDAYAPRTNHPAMGIRKNSQSRLPSEDEIKMKIQEEVEKQYKMLFQQQEHKQSKTSLRNYKTANSSSSGKRPQIHKEQPRAISHHDKTKKIAPQDDRTYLRYKRHMFDDTKEMLLANQIKVEVKPEPKKKKLDPEKEQLQREIEDLKHQMQAQKELFEVKQSLNELKEEMRRKHEEYKKSEFDERKDPKSSSRPGSKKMSKEYSTPRTMMNQQRAPTVGQIKESPVPSVKIPLLDLQPRKVELVSSNPFVLQPIELRPKSSDRMRWHNQPRDPKKQAQNGFKSPFKDFVNGVGGVNRPVKGESNNMQGQQKTTGSGPVAQQSFSRVDAQTEWKETCIILEKCDIIYNQSGQVLKQKSTFTRSDITNIAQGFSRKIVKIEQDNFNKDWQLEKEKQNCKQLLAEKQEDYEKKLKFMQDQVEFEKKAISQESIKLKEKIQHMTQKRAQEREKLFDDMVQIKKLMDKQNSQLQQANNVLQKNFDLNVIGLDFANDLQLIIESYNQDLQKDNMKKLQPFDGHGMKPQAPKNVKDLLQDIQKMRRAYAGRGNSQRGRNGSPPYGEKRLDNRPRWSEEALEQQMQMISEYITNQLDSGKETNVFKQHEKIRADIIEPILQNSNFKPKRQEGLSGKGSPRNSLTMSLTMDDQIYGGGAVKQTRTQSQHKMRKNFIYGHQSLSNILQMQNTQSLNMSLTNSEKEIDPNQALSTISKPVASFKMSQNKRQSMKTHEYGDRDYSQKSANALLELPQNESRARSKKFRNSRSLSYHKSNNSTLSNHSAGKMSRGIYIQKVDEDTHRSGRFQNKNLHEPQPQRGYIDLTPEKFVVKLDERTDQHSAVQSLRSQLKLKATQLEKAHNENTNMQKRIHQLQNEAKALQDGNSHRVRTNERVASLEKKYYTQILSVEKQKKTISDLQVKLQRQTVHTQQWQNTVNQLEQKNKVIQNTLAQREWMQSLNESVKALLEQGRTNQLSLQQREQMQAVFSHKLVNEIEMEKKHSENMHRLVSWLLNEQIFQLYQIQENIRTSLEEAYEAKEAQEKVKLMPDAKNGKQEAIYDTLEAVQGKKHSDRKRSQGTKKQLMIDENQVYMDYIGRQIGALKHKMLMKYQEYQEFKDFQSEQESDMLYKILMDVNGFDPGAVSAKRPDRLLPPLALQVPQQITPRQSVSPGSGFEKPPVISNHKYQTQLMYSPRNNSQLRPRAQKRAASRSPSGRLDLRQLVNQKEKRPDEMAQTSSQGGERVWLELHEEEVTNVFYGDKEVIQYLNTRSNQNRERGSGSKPQNLNADLQQQLGPNRVRFLDQHQNIDIVDQNKKTGPGTIAIYDDGESSEEAAIAQEKSEQIMLKGLSTENKESLRKKKIQNSPQIMPVVIN